MTTKTASVDRDGRERDRLGRTQPHRLNFLTFARSIRGFAERWRAVPGKPYREVDGGIRLPCKCGVVMYVPMGHITGCAGCDRFFFWTGHDLLVGNSPVQVEVGNMT